ncbi:VWA domain-containing protein [Tropicibacter alexandrii]|uniref:VWA domain-containing protein n=1 Tax=Tropicibacter alexandrii TaxID=2267683 RepID=UPI000EF53E37|nr:VWA domain-containing protein [Tropicibacter alexandrii]
MQKLRQRVASLVGALGTVCVAVQPVYADASLLSTVTYVESGKQMTVPIARLKDGTIKADSANAVFNISISLEEDPQGDDDSTVDAGTTDADQRKYEEKIREFADAVFQSTNGAHKIGRVTIFRNQDQFNNADVQWHHDCGSSGPSTWINSFGNSRQIRMCNIWTGSSTMDTAKGGGFTLAHEWGHYAYGLFDEYASNCGQNPESSCSIFKPRSTDVEPNPSIMNDQWLAARATGANLDALEFSTDDVEPYATQADGDDKNAQARVYGEPGWDTLVRDPATDPRHSFMSPARTRYTTLAAPAGPDFTQNDDESTARSELNIIWAGNRVVELMIDTSGSMGGTPIANARTAGSLLVGQLVPGVNAVGVGRFTGSASQVFAIQDIPDPDTGVRAAAQAVINGLSSGGSTDIEEAALLALSEVTAFQGGTRPAVVYLLTDGQSFVNQATVINAYTAAKVPLVTFGFGPNVDTALLQNLANSTGGRYFFSPTALSDIQQAFVAANAAFSSAVVVNSSAALASASSTEVRDILLDSTLADAAIVVTYPGPQADIDLRLLDSSGADTGAVFTCSGSGDVSCEAVVDVQTLGAGTYGVEIVNNAAGDKDVSILISGNPTGENFDIAVEFDNANYPSDFTIRALVRKGAPLTGLNVVATVTKPDNSVVELTLLDDGLGADADADDGVYSISVPYDQNGTYSATVRADNAAGNAQTSFNGVLFTRASDGPESPAVPQSVSENFTRVAITNAAVNGFQTDDHSDDPAVPGTCTAVADDNIDVPGRIDTGGDVDCFVFVPTSTSDDMMARLTSLAGGMEAIVKVYDAAGTTELLSVDLSSSENPASGVIARIPAGSLDAAGHVVTVEHTDSAAGTGTYALSIGAPLKSDTPVVSFTGGGNGGGGGDSSGGALGPLSVLISALLAAVGLRQRRRRV